MTILHISSAQISLFKLSFNPFTTIGTVCHVLNAESSSCVEFVSAAAFSVSHCVRVEAMGYDVQTFKNG